MESNLEVWKVAHQLTLAVYKITSDFPKSEQFGLISQVRRSASSVPTKILLKDRQDNIKKNSFRFYIFQKDH
ncbi:four helix bundle protein [Flavobacterium sp. 123]|uniref:four helix bundle protein n=1 Tax=Flavobacterium sp. 123 TaxID=2135627 RepID=UPI0021014548|nr:four helix bundle protein [Flavobacterium sp. 123]